MPPHLLLSRMHHRAWARSGRSSASRDAKLRTSGDADVLVLLVIGGVYGNRADETARHTILVLRGWLTPPASRKMRLVFRGQGRTGISRHASKMIRVESSLQ
jgi:hypothetical protein